MKADNMASFLVVCLAFAAIALCFGLAVLPSGLAFAESETYVLLADTHLGLPNGTPSGETESALAWASTIKDLKAVAIAGDVTDRGGKAAYDEWELLFNNAIKNGARRIQALGDHDTGLDGEYLEHDPALTVKGGLANFLKTNGGAVTSFNTFEHANIITIGGVRASGYSIITNSML